MRTSHVRMCVCACYVGKIARVELDGGNFHFRYCSPAGDLCESARMEAYNSVYGSLLGAQHKLGGGELVDATADCCGLRRCAFSN